MNLLIDGLIGGYKLFNLLLCWNGWYFMIAFH